ncbi:hypothetical protein D3C87_1603240 [compost metagenome]
MREYEGKQYPQLRISTIDLVGGKSDGGSQPKPQQSSPKPQPQPQPAPDDGFDDSSIPF